ncbi:SulP family inorganic anion transporter [Schlegelella sp. S2-27]|uniref:SulP family inorganic anion transporter n=1 Tax=Caldimonas mangrovi TaxID=2944811 RepID=A0ABT0YUY5_9BURK|nr:SulP family inorganic anion transporter [Caldimonas mangrovi]MCM5682560.1 SulP family inorganic anion transporter [Caldimonas mangrovi]
MSIKLPGPLGLEMAEFRPRLFSALRGYDSQRLASDVSAGLTVGIVALPLAMAFAIASGVKPEQGVFTAIIAGFLISALGGSSVQIGGPAGAFIVIVYGIVQRYGLGNLLIATVLAGGLLFLMGLFKLGVLVRYIPVTIVIGFTNGIAVLIALSQVKDLLGLDIDKLPADFFTQIQVLGRHLGSVNPIAVGIGLACLAIVVAWPKLYALPSAIALSARSQLWLRRLARLPGTIIALGLATAATAWLSLPVETIGSRFGGIPQGLPSFAFPDFSWEGAKQLFIPTITIALLGAIESLLCARVADNLTELPRHDPNQELMAQGVANIVTPFFGGIPATGTIARTVTNVRSGAATPVAGIVHSLTLLLVVLVAAPLASHVPLAALAGILLFVAWNMGEWREFARLRQFTLPYRITLVGTFVLTVVFDLTVAVEVGLVMACVFFIYRMSVLFRIAPLHLPAAGRDVQGLSLYGSLFFGAVAKVEEVSEHLRPGTRVLILEMHRLISIDTTGLDALEQLHRDLERKGVQLMLCELNDQPKSLMQRSGFAARIGERHIVDHLGQALARAHPPDAAAAPPV